MSQVRKLEEQGITTVRQLAEADDAVAGIMPGAFQRLRAQARLQVRCRDTGQRCYEILPLQEGRGFARLPRPDANDLFLDLEGDPLYPDCLEYLIGLYSHDTAGQPWFRAFWAHDHEAERREGLSACRPVPSSGFMR
jgi:predicted RecB family nuclease